MIKAGIIGGSGYTGGELIRLLLNHSNVEIDFVFSTTRAGKSLTTAHPDLLGQTELEFTGKVNLNIDVVFLCLGHGNSSKFLASFLAQIITETGRFISVFKFSFLFLDKKEEKTK